MNDIVYYSLLNHGPFWSPHPSHSLWRVSVIAAVTRPNKQELAYGTLRERLLNGTYVPGHRLVIDTLATELGVSAVPVREAIRRLEAEGLVLHRPNVGAQVTPADPLHFEESMIVLAVLEGYATALAAPLVDETDLGRLRELNEAMVGCMDSLDATGFGRANREFHAVIYERCPNPYLVETLKETGQRLDAIRRTAFTHIAYRGWDSIAEHRHLIELIENRASFDEIEEAARAHKLGTVESFRRRSTGRGSEAVSPAVVDQAEDPR